MKTNENNKKRRKPKSKITFILIFLIAVLFVSTVVTVTRGIKDKSNAYVANELSDKMYISEVRLSKRITGTGPFDNGTGVPGAGQDYSAEDDYVRTNDVVTYTLEAVINPNLNAPGVSNTSSFNGGIVKVRATLPDNTYFLWNEDAWMQNVEISEDGKTIYAEYDTSISGEQTAPGIQTLSFTLKSKGIASPKTNVGNPSFEIWMDGNKPDNASATGVSYKYNISNPLYVTGRPAFNIKLVGDDEEGVANTINGRKGKYSFFGIVVGIQQDISELPDFRGIEFPEGDFTINIRLDYKYKKAFDGDDKYKSVSESDPKGYGIINGTQMVAYGLNAVRNENFYPGKNRTLINIPRR